MEETFHKIHHHEHGEGDVDEEEPSDEDGEEGSGLDSASNGFFEEDLGELTVSK